jgi:hypothetical protein
MSDSLGSATTTHAITNLFRELRLKVNATSRFPGASGDDVWYEPAFKQLDFVLYAQFPALHPRHLKLIGAAASKQGHDGGIEIAMFFAQQAEPQFDLLCFQASCHPNDPALPIPVFNWSHSP